MQIKAGVIGRVALIGAIVMLMSPAAQAVPSFARQTSMACEACHTVFPELTHFGRVFKANGYVLDNLKPVRGVTASKQEILSLSQLPPISIMGQISSTSYSKSIPDASGLGNSQNNDIAFPQQLSLFYAGKIAPQFGAFFQLTYENAGSTFAMDNVDLRYANLLVLPTEQSLIYGVTLNNNPTVQDLWNSTPAFGFPYAASNATVAPLAGTAIDGTFGQDVAGLTVYLWWNEQLYGEVGAYRSAKQGSANSTTGEAGPLDGTSENVISGGAPYFRLAYERNWDRHSLEVGVYGTNFKTYPGGNPDEPGTLSGPTNRFKDVAEDVQYQFIGDKHLLSLMGTRIHEKMTLDASALADASNPTDDLTTVRVTGTYYYKRRMGGSLQYFSTKGSSDALLYPADAPVVSSASGSPDTKGWVAELDYVPWLNTKLSAQFTHFSRFNGGSSDYDGFGRNASDNNSVYLLLWFAY